MLNQKHFDNCIAFSLESYGRYSKQTSIPSVHEFVSFVESLKQSFSTTSKKTRQPVRQSIQLKPKNNAMIDAMPYAMPNRLPMNLEPQLGGSREEVISYVKTLFIRQFGLTVYEHGFHACELLETVLNILAYAGWAYTIFVPSDTGAFGLSENSAVSIHYVMQQFADPGYAIMRLLPSLDSHLQELTFGHLYQYASRLYTDYQLTRTEGVSAVAILTKLLFVNAKSYEYLYIRPIICIFAQVHEKCKERCKSLTRHSSRETENKKTRKARKSRKSRKPTRRKTRKTRKKTV